MNDGSVSAERWPRGITVKTAHIRAALSNPPPPPIRLSNGGTRGMLREGGRQGLRWWWLGQTDGSNLVRRPKPCSQSLLTQAHPCSHCYPRISSLRPTLGRWKRRRLTDCCVSLMYEAALRIDVLEMVNSRFHQTRQESGSLNCQMYYLFVSFVLFYGVVTSGHCGPEGPEWKMRVCFVSLGACMFSVWWYFKLLNVMLEVNPKKEGLHDLCSFWPEGFIPYTLWLVLIPRAHWLDRSIN